MSRSETEISCIFQKDILYFRWFPTRKSFSNKIKIKQIFYDIPDGNCLSGLKYSFIE
jgi:hypothetical protein